MRSRPAFRAAPALDRRAPRPLPLAAGSADAPHPAAAAATCEECLGPLEPLTTPAAPCPTPPPSPPGPSRSGATASGCRSRASRRLPRQRLHPAGRVAGAGPRGSAWRASGSRTTPSAIPRSRFKDRVVATALNAALGARSRHRGLRLHRQPGQRGRGPGGAGRASRLDLHPARSRARQGGGHGGLRSAPRPGARDLRRREPPLLPGGRPLRLGPGQHQPARLLRRGLEDRWPSRSPSSSAGGCRRRWWRRWRAARCSPSWRRDSASSARPGWCRARRRGSTAPRPSGCAPIVRLVEGGGDQLEPVHAEHHRALDRDRQPGGRPLRRDAIRSTGGWAAGVSETALVDGIRLLAETTGVFTETAGGVTVAGALALARAGQAPPGGRGRPLHHRQRTQDRRGAAGRVARGAHHRPTTSRTGGSVWP